MSINFEAVGGIGVEVDLKETIKNKDYFPYIKSLIDDYDGEFDQILEWILKGTNYKSDVFCLYDEQNEYIITLKGKVPVSKIEEELNYMKIFLKEMGIYFFDKTEQGKELCLKHCFVMRESVT